MPFLQLLHPYIKVNPKIKHKQRPPCAPTECIGVNERGEGRQQLYIGCVLDGSLHVKCLCIRWIPAL